MVYDRMAIAAAAALGIAAAPAAAQLRAGAARIDETGPFGASQSGKYDHERVYTRAIVIENGGSRAALITLEGTGDRSQMLATRRAVARELGSRIENVIVTNTHTHSGSVGRRAAAVAPGATPSPSPTILRAVRQARAALAPAVMGYGTGTLALNVNRDAIDPVTRKWTQAPNPDGPVDRTVSVLTLAKPGGEPIAVYVNYAMHPINGFVLGVVSGDFPAAMSRYVEKAFGDSAVVAFSQGTSGDVNPLYLRPSTNVMAQRAGIPASGYDMNRETAEGPLRLTEMGSASGTGAAKPPADPGLIDGLFRFIESQGQVLGEEVIRVMSLTKVRTADVRIEGKEETVTCPGRERIVANPFDPANREGQEGVYKDGAPVDLHVGMLGLGNVALTSINGEVYTLIGTRIKAEAPMANTIVATLANEGVRGYIPDDSAFGHQTFQVLNSPLKPGCAERGITDAVVRLENAYLKGR